MRFLDPAALRAARRIERPPTWYLIENPFQPDAYQALAESYPREGFTTNERNSGSKKHYRFDVCNLIDHDHRTASLQRVAEVWRDFVEFVSGSAYRKALSERVGVDLSAASVSLGLYRYGPGDWVAPHLDKDDKLINQLFYFNTAWDPAWGGSLEMLSHSDLASSCASLPPVYTHSAIIVRTSQTWHMVKPVACDAPQHRLSAQLELWAT